MTDEALPLPLCVYCGAPWDEPIMDPEVSVSENSKGETTTEVDWTLSIYCSGCERLVYANQGSDIDRGWRRV